MISEIARLIEAGFLGEAERACHAAVAANPGGPEAFAYLVHLATIGRRTSRPEVALQAARSAIALEPGQTATLNSLGLVLWLLGHPGQSANWTRRSLSLAINQPAMLTHLVWALNGMGHPAAEAAARAFDAVTRRPLMPPPPRSEGRLRIGIVSPDFYYHVCMTFLRPLIERIDRRRFRLFAYSAVRAPDQVTEELRSRFDTWHNIFGQSDEAVASLVQQDRIDLLIDLAGHTPDARLGVFAMHPARTQASWLGYNGTTGLAAMNWRIADPWIAPDEGQEWFSEQVWRLPRACHCWRPPGDAPLVSPAPSTLGRPFTFGSFNNMSKLSDETVHAWASVLRAVSGSRLLLKSIMANDETTRQRLARRFEAAGIDRERILFRPPTRTAIDHLAAYADVDVALDPMPYNGTTTTCEALWMGVPVVTVRGTRMLSRISYSLLAALKLEDRLAARTVEEMVEICTRLAASPSEVAQLRQEIRPRFEKSSLRDETGFARAMERAFMTMIKQGSS